MLARIANREDPDQKKQSDLDLHYLSRPFQQVTTVQNFRTITIVYGHKACLSGQMLTGIFSRR